MKRQVSASLSPVICGAVARHAGHAGAGCPAVYAVDTQRAQDLCARRRCAGRWWAAGCLRRGVEAFEQACGGLAAVQEHRDPLREMPDGAQASATGQECRVGSTSSTSMSDSGSCTRTRTRRRLPVAACDSVRCTPCHFVLPDGATEAALGSSAGRVRLLCAPAIRAGACVRSGRQWCRSLRPVLGGEPAGRSAAGHGPVVIHDPQMTDAGVSRPWRQVAAFSVWPARSARRRPGPGAGRCGRAGPGLAARHPGHGGLHRAGTVGGADAGGDARGGPDRDGEGCSVWRPVAVDHGLERSFSQRSRVSVRQIRPRPCLASEVDRVGVTWSAASTRSPSFSGLLRRPGPPCDPRPARPRFQRRERWACPDCNSRRQMAGCAGRSGCLANWRSMWFVVMSSSGIDCQVFIVGRFIVRVAKMGH